MGVRRHRYTVAGWGAGELWESDGVVVEHSFDHVPDGAAADRLREPYDPVRGPGPEGAARSPENTLSGAGAPMGDGFVPDLIRRIHRQLAGEHVGFADVALDLEWCTPFQRAVVEELRTVPWGEVVTYGELAALAGYPGAARAAGSVCAGNRFWLFVPCHRVVAASGLGGYGASGSAPKRRLLELEGVPVAAL